MHSWSRKYVTTYTDEYVRLKEYLPMPNILSFYDTNGVLPVMSNTARIAHHNGINRFTVVWDKLNPLYLPKENLSQEEDDKSLLEKKYFETITEKEYLDHRLKKNENLTSYIKRKFDVKLLKNQVPKFTQGVYQMHDMHFRMRRHEDEVLIYMGCIFPRPTFMTRDASHLVFINCYFPMERGAKGKIFTPPEHDNYTLYRPTLINCQGLDPNDMEQGD